MAMIAVGLNKVIATVFTTVVAPVVVSVIVQCLAVAKLTGPQIPGTSGTDDPERPTGVRDIVVSQGYGITLEEARREALRTALRKVISSITDPAGPAAKYQAVCEAVVREPQQVILHCEDLSYRKQNGQGREQYRWELTAEIARGRLAELLRAAHLRVREDGW
jgi:hypothetical protein